jgi:hypothetical protein
VTGPEEKSCGLPLAGTDFAPVGRANVMARLVMSVPYGTTTSHDPSLCFSMGYETPARVIPAFDIVVDDALVSGAAGGFVPPPDVGVTEFDASEAAPVPTLFVAATVNIYDVPFVRPVTVIGLDVPVAVILPGFDLTV